MDDQLARRLDRLPSREISDQTGHWVTAFLSVLTVGLLPLVWRGEWAPRKPRFSVQMLATVMIMMLVSYHNHAHSAALLLIPGIAVAAEDVNPPFLAAILVAMLVAPTLIYFLTASMIYVSWLFIALMLAALWIIVDSEFRRARWSVVRTRRNDASYRQLPPIVYAARVPTRRVRSIR